MKTLVPFAATNPKTRLSPILSEAERKTISRLLLKHVVETLAAAGYEPTVVTTAPLKIELPTTVSTQVDTQPLTAAVNDQLSDEKPTLIVMADLPLITPGDIGRLTTDADITIAPGLGGGTNALCIREPAFRVDYHGASCRDHCRIAADCGATVETVDSRRLATDIDEPQDLVEILLHGDGRIRAFLEDAGFKIETGDGRVRLSRNR